VEATRVGSYICIEQQGKYNVDPIIEEE